MIPNYPPNQNPIAYNPNYGVPMPQKAKSYGYPPQGQYPMPTQNPMMNPPPSKKNIYPSPISTRKNGFPSSRINTSTANAKSTSSKSK